VEKSERKRILGKPRCRWVNNIKMSLRGVGWVGTDWIDRAEDRHQWRALVIDLEDGMKTLLDELSSIQNAHLIVTHFVNPVMNLRVS
jgi:hypothetical protein